MEPINQQDLTADQLAEQKEKMLTFYKESLPYLTAQYEYEEMLLKIDEARFKRSTVQFQYAMNLGYSKSERF